MEKTKSNYIKLKKTEFSKDLGSRMKFNEFEKKYAKLLEGEDLKECYSKLGGKITK